jgi:hypothetical protein
MASARVMLARRAHSSLNSPRHLGDGRQAVVEGPSTEARPLLDEDELEQASTGTAPRQKSCSEPDLRQVPRGTRVARQTTSRAAGVE